MRAELTSVFHQGHLEAFCPFRVILNYHQAAMPCSYSCFISYRNPHNKGAQKLIESFHEELSTHLALRVSAPAYLDVKRLQGGDLYNPKLAEGICQSSCVILLYSPTYLESVYCAREFRGAVQLEAKRLPILSQKNLAQNLSLVIPVMFRGASLPTELRRSTKPFEFTKTLLRRRDFQTQAAAEIMDKIAEAVFVRHRSLAKVPEATDCQGDFELPTAEEVEPWRRSVLDSLPVESAPGYAA